MPKGKWTIELLNALQIASNREDTVRVLTDLQDEFPALMEEIYDHHGLGAWLLERLRHIDPLESLYNRAALIEFERNRRLGAMQDLFELHKLQTELLDKGLRFKSLKGEGMSFWYFGDPVYREAKDVDLLVERDQFMPMLKFFAEKGADFDRRVLDFSDNELDYFFYYEKDYPIYYNGLWIELHSRILTKPTREDSFEWLAEREDGGFVSFPLSQESLAHYTLVHGSLGSWTRAKWLYDAWMACQAMTQDQWNKVISISRAEHTVSAVTRAIAEVETAFGPLDGQNYRSTEQNRKHAFKKLCSIYDRKPPCGRHRDGFLISDNIHHRVQAFTFRYFNVSELLLRRYSRVKIIAMTLPYLAGQWIDRYRAFLQR